MNILPTVHIVDDDEAIRDSLRLLIKVSGMHPQTYSSAEDLLNNADLTQHCCLIVDVRMPGMSGLELQHHLNEKQYKIPLIIITGHGDISLAVEAMKSGAYDFFEKPVDDDRLVNRIRESLDSYAELTNQKKQIEDANELISTLTGREKEIMDLLVQGKFNKLIASELNISVRTVEAHRGSIMHKMKAQSLSDIVRIALTCQ